MRRKFSVRGQIFHLGNSGKAGRITPRPDDRRPVVNKETPRMSHAYLTKPALLTGALLLSASTAWAAGGEVRQACASDARALCSGVKPGGGRTAACMREHTDKLSQNCRQALSATRAPRQ
jgi:hypothetical protein